MALPTASWATGPLADPAFQQWMLQIAQGSANRDAIAQGDQPGAISVDRYYQELGEGNQGQALYSFFQKGVTADQVNQSQSGQAPPDIQAAIGRLQAGQGTAADQQLMNQGLIRSESGDGGNQYFYNPTTYAEGPLAAQPLYNHGMQTGLNTGAFGFDPNAGFVTRPWNVHAAGTNAMDTVGNMMPLVIATLMSAATLNPAMLGAQFTGGIGAMGSTLFKQIIGALFNQRGG